MIKSKTTYVNKCFNFLIHPQKEVANHQTRKEIGKHLHIIDALILQNEFRELEYLIKIQIHKVAYIEEFTGR